MFTSFNRFPLLSYASAFKFITSPVLIFSGFSAILKSILLTLFFFILIVFEDFTPSKTTLIVADPDFTANTLFESSISNLSLDDEIENSRLEKYLSALSDFQ